MTSRPFAPWRLPFAALVALVLLVGACGDDDTSDDTEAPAGDTDGTGSDDEATETETETGTEGDDGAEETASGDADCLVGTWEASPAQVRDSYASFMPPEAEVTAVSDPFVLTLDGSSYEWNPAGTLDMTIAGNTAQTTISGNVTGDYSVEGDTITTSLDDPNLDMQVTVGGVTIDGSEFGNDLLATVPINGAAFACDDATLRLTSDVNAAQFVLELGRVG